MGSNIKVVELLNNARQSGVHVYLDQNRLCVKVRRAETVSPELLDILKLHKAAITDFLLNEANSYSEIQHGVQTISPYNKNDLSRPPLSFAQERLWFIDKLQGSSNYHVSFVVDIKGKIDPEILEKSFLTVINRHEVLRTVFGEEDGVPFQQVIAAEGWNLSRYKKRIGVKEQEELISQEAGKAFDLSKHFMIRAQLAATEDGNFLLIIVIHHIAFDGWSGPIFLEELIASYTSLSAGRTPLLPDLPIQYADYAVWQKAHLLNETLEIKLSYWEKKLAGLTPLMISSELTRPPIQQFDGDVIFCSIPKTLDYQCRKLSEIQGTTTFMTLLAAFKVLLHRYTGQTDICVGTPLANRTQQETIPLIGFFVNSLPLRTEIGPDLTFTEVLMHVKETVLDCFHHQDVPFEKIVDKVLKERDMSRSPLFQIMFVFQNNSTSQPANIDKSNFNLRSSESQTSKFDITFTLEENEDGIGMSVEYCTSLFTKDMIQQLADHYKTLLSSILHAPNTPVNKLKFLTQEEENILLFDFNPSKTLPPSQSTIVTLFESRVEMCPDSIAVWFENKQLSYRELNDSANQMAWFLKEKYNIGRGKLVGVKLKRNESIVITLLGILKSGAAYLPIDPEYPVERIDYMISDSACSFIMDQNKLIEYEQYAPAYSKRNPLPTNAPSDIAYVIYTSGSTGNPKGVVIDHQNVHSFVESCSIEFMQDDFDTVLFHTTICFDLSIFEMFFPLCTGKKIRLISNALDLPNHMYLSNKLLLTIVPSVLAALQKEELDIRNISVLNLGGETIPLQLASKLDFSRTNVRNLYGPSEATTYCTSYQMKKGAPILIGRPTPNAKIYILNESDQLQPLGVTGEICVGGPGVARGYINNEKLTAEKFVDNPFEPGNRLYRTGDLGYWRRDGNIGFVGRKDDQIKIRGFRIEPAEIENRLVCHTQITAAVVIDKCNDEGEKELVAWYVADQPLEFSDLRKHLAETLPVYMIPRHFVHVPEIPLSPTGKTDKRSLPNPDASNVRSGIPYSAPRNETDQRLVKIWEETLKLNPIGIDDNFFTLGGHSLLATRLMARISKDFSLQLPISLLFKYSTVRLLADRVALNSDLPSDSVLISINTRGTLEPVFCAPPAGGNVLVYYELCAALGENQPLYAFQAPGVDLQSVPLTSVQEMAAVYINEMQKIDAIGPYTLLGYSFGGYVAYEMALQLTKKGFPVRQLILFDSLSPDKSTKDYREMLPESYTDWLIHFKDIFNLTVSESHEKLILDMADLRDKSHDEQLQLLYAELTKNEEWLTVRQLKAFTDVYMINASISYVPDCDILMDIPIILFKADKQIVALTNDQINKSNEILDGKMDKEDLGWGDFTAGKINIHHIPCSHLDMMQKPNIGMITRYLKNYLR